MAKKTGRSSRIAISDVRETLSSTLDRVEVGSERIIVNRRGKDIAALVPVADLKLLQAIEDRMDIEDARAALAETRKKGSASWKSLKSQLGL